MNLQEAPFPHRLVMWNLSVSNLGSIDPHKEIRHRICCAVNVYPSAQLLPLADKPFVINYAAEQLPYREGVAIGGRFYSAENIGQNSELRGADDAVCAQEPEAIRVQLSRQHCLGSYRIRRTTWGV